MCQAIARNLKLATMEQALKSAGLRGIRWHPPQVSPEGLRDQSNMRRSPTRTSAFPNETEFVRFLPPSLC